MGASAALIVESWIADLVENCLIRKLRGRGIGMAGRHLSTSYESYCDWNM